MEDEAMEYLKEMVQEVVDRYTLDIYALHEVGLNRTLIGNILKPEITSEILEVIEHCEFKFPNLQVVKVYCSLDVNTGEIGVHYMFD